MCKMKFVTFPDLEMQRSIFIHHLINAGHEKGTNSVLNQYRLIFMYIKTIDLSQARCGG